jgi:hypothetical protein
MSESLNNLETTQNIEGVETSKSSTVLPRKEYSDNNFKFALHQGDVLFCEKNINANQFSPFTRYTVNIKDVLPRYVNSLQKVLSKRKYVCSYDASDKKLYDFFGYYTEMVKKYKPSQRESISYAPKPVVKEVEGVKHRGVEFRLTLHINDNLIVEREFFVEGFNIMSRFSEDLVETFNDVVDDFEAKMRKNDIRNIWDDYTIITKNNMNIIQVRSLSYEDRRKMLNRLYKN